MKDKTPKNDRELIANLYAIARAMQSELHHINSQCWALTGITEDLKTLAPEQYKRIDRIRKNIDEMTRIIYDGEKVNGERLFPDVTETIERSAVRLIELGESRGWSDYIGWDDRLNDFAMRGSILVEKYGTAFAERKDGTK